MRYTIDNLPKLFYAPMCHLGGRTIRQVVRHYFPDICFYTQMYCATAMTLFKHQNYTLTQKYIADMHKQIYSDEKLFIQLYGNTAEEFTEAVRVLSQEFPNASFDLNLGCPANCADNGKYGIYFSYEVQEVLRTIKMIKESQPDILLSAKIRYRQDFDQTVEFIHQLCQSEVDIIVVHCRKELQANKFAQHEAPNYQWLLDILKSDTKNKKFIINGGLTSISSGELLLSQSNKLIGYMIGMAFVGNPSLAQYEMWNMMRVAFQVPFSIKEFIDSVVQEINLCKQGTLSQQQLIENVIQIFTVKLMNQAIDYHQVRCLLFKSYLATSREEAMTRYVNKLDIRFRDQQIQLSNQLPDADPSSFVIYFAKNRNAFDGLIYMLYDYMDQIDDIKERLRHIQLFLASWKTKTSISLDLALECFYEQFANGRYGLPDIEFWD